MTPKTTMTPPRQRLTVRVPAELAERVKNAAYWNPRLSLTAITELGLKLALEQIEADGPYPRRDGELRGGAPLKQILTEQG